MMRSACTSTLREKVYNAKLEVFISAPRIYMTQAGSSSGPCFFSAGPGEVAFEAGFGVCQLALQGVILSLRRTPRSRANCSNVMGRKEAKGIVSCHQRHRGRDKASAYPLHRLQRSPLPTHSCTIPPTLSG